MADKADKKDNATLAEKAGIPLTYSKWQFLKSKEYKKYRDLLNVLLKDNVLYGKDEVKKIIDGYLKRGVK